LRAAPEETLRSPQFDTSDVVSLSQALANNWLFGYMPTMVSFATEPDQLPTLRFMAAGAVSVIMVSPVAMEKMIPQGGAEPISLRDCRVFLREMRQEQLTHAAEAGAKIYHGRVQAGDFLYTPAGWLVGCCSLNNQLSAGIRRSYLAKATEKTQEEQRKEQLGKVMEMMGGRCDETKLLGTLVDFLDAQK
jgi:hypothetical protein